LHKNAFGGRDRPGPAGEATAPGGGAIAGCYKGEVGGKGKKRVGNSKEERKVREGIT